MSGKQALDALLKVNKRLNTAYVLKESFGQLWDYERETWARKFFDNWRASLKLAYLSYERSEKPFLRLKQLFETSKDPVPHRPAAHGFATGA